ncbi:MAG TPA: class I SAM-dependent methyltransferase [Candidatus Binataceae bacterium]|nr:class I SAM-dependent methyltransferase [Candidatus Binataceae bacterium]
MPERKERPIPGPELFHRVDEADDEAFYDFPRLTVHIDDSAVAAVSEIYGSRLPTGGALLDLMSSWRSHLPASLNPARVVGLGLSRPEMADNPALTEIVVHNVNREPRLPFDDRSFDGAVMTVSVQYLIHPIETFAEVGRVLKPAAPFIVAFSNRMFPTKAVAVWVNATEPERVALVERYFAASGIFRDVEFIDRSRRPGPSSDPIYAVMGIRA